MILRLSSCVVLGLALGLVPGLTPAMTAMAAAAEPPAAGKSPAPAASNAAKPADAEAKPDVHAQLDEELSETGGSATDIILILEKHLKTHAGCNKRNEIIRAMAQLAVETKDQRRVVLYGAEAIDHGTLEPKMLELVTRLLLDKSDRPSQERALKYATLYASALRAERTRLLAQKVPSAGDGRHLQETEDSLGQAQAYLARALLALGQPEPALAAADEGWAVVPMLDLAVERARALEALGRTLEALEAASDAFLVEDGRATPQGRLRSRELLSEIGAKAGLDPAEKLLAAWDRTQALIRARAARLRNYDPNLGVTAPLEFTMSKLDGAKMALGQVKGKVVVFDFWATWCGPCRVQHPLYEQVKARFQANTDVVFLAVATDEDHGLVKPFLERQKWSQEVLLDDGLASFFRVNSIPTTIVLNKRGEIESRMPGFVPEKFVETLSQRIEAALADN